MLEGLRVIEGSAFVAAPSGGMTLAQLGADVIRFDQIGGGIDYRRWPLTAAGVSLYWAGLNKNKRSIAVDLRNPAGQEVVTALIRAAGTFLTNFPAQGWLAYDTLRSQRPDLVMCAITGNRDGSTALDYTVNAAVGYPAVTGPPELTEPVNHVLPAWDLICGQTAALGILAADRQRLRTGAGASLSIALSDVAFAAVGALGHIAEAQINGTERARFGNDLYGAFGAEFVTADGRRLYAVAISPKQWVGLQSATETTAAIAAVERELGANFADEGDRFAHREVIKSLIQRWVGERSLAEVSQHFNDFGVCWGPYQTFRTLVETDPRVSEDSELFRTVTQPDVGEYLVPGSPVALAGKIPIDPQPAPRLGQHTEEILADDLGLSTPEIAKLRDDGVVSWPAP